MPAASASGTIRLSNVVSALSAALDLTEGQPMGHAMRSCILGMRIAEEMRLSPQECSDLYYASLLKDSGCSSNSARLHQIMEGDDLRAKREVKYEDWTRPSVSGLRFLLRNVLPGKSLMQRLIKSARLGVQQKRNNAAVIGARCERGAEIARKVGMTESAAEAIRCLDEHWNGGGYPEGRKGEEIPLLARIMSVSQTLEVFATGRNIAEGVATISERSGRWFDPEVVRAVRSLEKDEALWLKVFSLEAREHVLQMEPGTAIPASAEQIDRLCLAFAEVIDAKSPYTYRHSLGVAAVAVDIAEGLALAPETITMIRRAALLHDLGKLSVSNAILEKPGKLTSDEWEVMKTHPVYTRIILRMITGFENLAFVAGAHHERLDGLGYPDGLTARQLPLTARIICVADVYQALTEKRPYRDNLPLEVVFGIMEKEAPSCLDGDCLDALKRRRAGTPAGSVRQAKAASV